jgi:hypothetical protein
MLALEEGDRAYTSGAYEDAIRAYESYLQLAPVDSADKDEILFRLGLMSALDTRPTSGWPRAATYLRQLTQEFPQSPLATPANLILTMRSELTQLTADTQKRDERIKQLTTELDRLKKVDAERRRKP